MPLASSRVEVRELERGRVRRERRKGSERTIKLLSLFFLPDPQALPISHCGCYAGARGGSEGVSTKSLTTEPPFIRRGLL